MTERAPKVQDRLDPDVRFLLANERTLLAWVRTGLTLQAGGFALTHISSDSTAGKLSGIFAILFGGIVALIGYSRFRAADRAIRSNTLPKTGKGPAIEVMMVVAIAVILAAIQLVDIV
jgi:putative membrane protein